MRGGPAITCRRCSIDAQAGLRVTPDFARGYRVADDPGLRVLLTASFGGPAEAGLVDALRAGGLMAVELVLPVEGRIIACVALSRMVAPDGWLCLAPLCVAEDWRGRGIAVRMAQAAVRLAAGRTVVVLGAPSLYERAGFSLERAGRLTSPYPIRNTLIARPGDDVPEAELVYPAAFAGV